MNRVIEWFAKNTVAANLLHRFFLESVGDDVATLGQGFGDLARGEFVLYQHGDVPMNLAFGQSRNQ